MKYASSNPHLAQREDGDAVGRLSNWSTAAAAVAKHGGEVLDEARHHHLAVLLVLEPVEQEGSCRPARSSPGQRPATNAQL